MSNFICLPHQYTQQKLPQRNRMSVSCSIKSKLYLTSKTYTFIWYPSMKRVLKPYRTIPIVKLMITRKIFRVASWYYVILDSCYAQNNSLTYGTLWDENVLTKSNSLSHNWLSVTTLENDCMKFIQFDIYGTSTSNSYIPWDFVKVSFFIQYMILTETLG